MIKFLDTVIDFQDEFPQFSADPLESQYATDITESDLDEFSRELAVVLGPLRSQNPSGPEVEDCGETPVAVLSSKTVDTQTVLVTTTDRQSGPDSARPLDLNVHAAATSLVSVMNERPRATPQQLTSWLCGAFQVDDVETLTTAEVIVDTATIVERQISRRLLQVSSILMTADPSGRLFTEYLASQLHNMAYRPTISAPSPKIAGELPGPGDDQIL